MSLRGHASIIALALLAACARRPSTGNSPPVVASPQPSATPVASGQPAPSADDILQARLVKAVRELADVERMHEPEPPMGLIGLAPKDTAPSPIRTGAVSMAGRLPPEVIQRIVRKNYSHLRYCYEQALVKKPDLSGKVTTRFTIDKTGAVSDAKSTGDIPDKAVISCVEKAFLALSFPAPEGGKVNVVYPIIFEPGSDASPSASTAAPPALSATPEPKLDAPPAEGPWPIVVVHGRDALQNGTTLANLSSILDANRLQRVDGVFQALKKQRDAWKEAHPHTRFPGVAGLRVDADTPLLAVKSVFQTIAFAGYPNLFLQLASEPERIVDLRAIVPGPPEPNVVVTPRPPPRVLNLRFEGTDAHFIWQRGATVESDSTIARTAPDFAAKLCQEQKLQGAHRDPNDPFIDELVVHADNALGFQVLADLSRAVDSCKRPYAGKPDGVPVFWLSLSVM